MKMIHSALPQHPPFRRIKNGVRLAGLPDSMMSGSLGVLQTLTKSLTPADGTKVVVLEKSEFFYYTSDTLRAYVKESFAPKLFVSFTHTIPASAASFARIIRAVATKISAETNEVTYRAVGPNDAETGQDVVLDFDYLVVATGSSYTVPIKQDVNVNSRADIEDKLAEVRREIANAQSILIANGGSVGCEVASDIATKYPHKRITIVEAVSQLVADTKLRNKFRKKLAHLLKQLNVNVVLGERLTERLSGNNFGKQTLLTDKGAKLESDIQLLCGSFHRSPSFIKVNAQLQLDDPRFRHMFALGDASNHPAPKLLFIAKQQGQFLGKELLAVVRHKQQTDTKPYKQITEQTLLVMPLGLNGGVSQLPLFGGLVFGNFFMRNIKSKDYFVGLSWSGLNTKMPDHF